MSGGVDSSVAALLLKKSGFDPIGVFLNFWSEKNRLSLSNNKCCSEELYSSARGVAQRLGMPLYSLNLKELFKKKIVNYYISEYEKTRTPNPCVICNQEIKFGKLIEIARSLSARQIATGHYASITKKGNTYRLHRGKDKEKDQSYFLWRVDRRLLKSVRFPVGRLLKNEVRAIAKKHGLRVYDKKDSEGLCFVGDSNASFLSKYAKSLLEPGNVVDRGGSAIGRHKGLTFYSIGQRCGFEVTGDKWRKSRTDTPPLYVKGFNVVKNCLIVDKENGIYSKKMVLSSPNWLDDRLKKKAKKSPTLLFAQIRYLHKAVPCLVKTTGNKIHVVFKKPQRAVTPGQSCVFYKDDQLLGGGVIEK
jgi:tRNA-specific 2-thiouridylase